MMHEWMGHGFFMPWLIIPVIIVLCLVWIRSNNGHCNIQHRQDDEAVDIARKRFARGEIDEEAFDKIKQKLS